jgi:hypothetical protein
MTPQIDPMKQMPGGPTSFMTERNDHEVRCGMCARPVYVDDETYQKGIESEFEDLFRCEICAEEYARIA